MRTRLVRCCKSLESSTGAAVLYFARYVLLAEAESFVMALRFGLVPPIIHKERRVAYYKYLELYQVRELSDPLEKFIAEAIIETSESLQKL